MMKMGYIDQFVTSVTFNTEKVIEFRKQNVWKTIVYILAFVIITGAINVFLTWESSLELLSETWEAYGFSVRGGTDEEAMIFTHAFTQYVMIFIDLIAHFILISAIAYAGSRGYRTIGEVAYREAWNVTAYGISAPILVRLVVQGMGLEIPIMTFAYWGAIMVFSMMCVKKIAYLPPDARYEK